MKMLGKLLALVLALACAPALAQVTPGTSPLSIAKGGTAGATAGAARTNLAVPGLATNNTLTGDNYFKSGRPWFDVIAYGADPTGVADSTTAIQNAINAASVSSGNVYLPSGVYKTSAALTISAANGISLIGSGRLSAIIRSTSPTASIISITASYATIDSLTLQGPLGTVSTSGAAISANGSQGSKFTNLYISDVFSGISLNNSTAALVQFVKMFNIYGAPAVAISNGGGEYIVDNQLDQNIYGTAYTFSSGFGAWAASTAYTAGQVVFANGGWFVCAVSGTSTTGSGPVISAFNTQITDGTAKWYFNSATNSAGVSISSTANSNFITNNDISGPWANGIIVSNSDGSNLVGNNFGQTLGNAIQLGANATNMLVQGNNLVSIYGINSGAIVDATGGTATGTRVLGNYIQNTGRYGTILQSANFLVQGNTIKSVGLITGAYGIDVAANINSFNISGNLITASVGMTGPIRVAAGTSDFYNITGNVVTGVAVVDGGTGTHKTIMGNN